ncbi:probable F-box protein At4g22060 [Brassica napus]|uniref:probable F-box protein At4g22060 n=1 Tax=Brassica napus TaxID=3708 RepID=UPI00207863F1|nr:probable F-box protein At4g22060 [Brassica napus]
MDSLSPPCDVPRWSKLPSDLLHMVFERLGFSDFQRAKSVCPFWRSASIESAPNNQIPWMILFPEKGKDYCLLFNPEENNKTYRIQDLGVNFANSHCLAICGSWFFMRDPRYKLYIMNLFTRERIDLPSVESQVGMLLIERTTDDMFLVTSKESIGYKYNQEDLRIDLPFFWIDQKTKDYFVTCYLEGRVTAYAENGDKFWKQADLKISGDVVYKEHKLYLYDYKRDVKVFDFSGDSPRKIVETQVNHDPLCTKGMSRRVYPELGDVWDIKDTHLVVTVKGEFLRVKSIVKSDGDVWSFRIYKMDSSQSEWEKITSLGDEAILLDQRTTVLANAVQGIKRNSIYFSGIHHDYVFHRVWSEKDILNYSLDTHKIERPPPSFFSNVQSSDARWFVPN